MGYFKRKFNERFMSLMRGSEDIMGALPIPTISCWNMLNRENFTEPYIEPVKEYLIRRGTFLKKKLLLVAEDRNVVLKAASMIADSVNDEEDDDFYDFYDEDEEEGYEGEKVLWMDLPSMIDSDKKEVYCQTVIAGVDSTGLNDILFTGIHSAKDWNILWQCLAICKVNNQYVEINEKQLKHPIVQRMIYELGFEVLRLSKLEKDYYEKQVLDVLLDGAEYQLSLECGKKEWLRRLMKKRGMYIEEEDIATFLDIGVERAARDGDRKDLILQDFKDTISVDVKSAWDALSEMTGLQNLKVVAEEEVALVMEQQNNELLRCPRGHMIFHGRPGTGKTTGARILAEILDEAGCGNGSFVVATRKDLIGGYVGHTAPLVAKRFEEARGGILFVDEAGFFLNEEAGGFVNEALKEFVRYMEEYSDVTVVFAMYSQEAKRFLEMDAGLCSRIKRKVEFPDYSEKELLDIAVTMFENNGYHLSKKAYPVVKEYIRTAKGEEKEQFGNARNMRNLVDASMKELCLRHYRDVSTKDNRNITELDVKKAVDKLKGVRASSLLSFGFGAKDLKV